ncbi:hypothetical protein OESDEN_20041 [Oesophagostomum dentatum]|uniref:RRM domain-containing protein n=1 Tax=Oesophagostomum dentatum TaxID=61180 RepID=A0A0B1S8Q5_OESDE|nr:hypothetical protein OESDEN_20041 [Oesophagostomum dentatum]
MDQLCFSSGLNDSEKAFCVKNIPVGFKDWDLFHIFHKYGVVHSVKIPAKQSHLNSKYGFLVMEDFNGADEIRYQLKNGKFLTESGVCLQVSSIHNGENQRSRTDGEGMSRYVPIRNAIPTHIFQQLRPPFKEVQNTSPTFAGRNRLGEKQITQKSPQTSAPIRCFSQDLPLRVPVKVRVVDSPRPCESADEGFLFHVVPLEQDLSEDYTKLQRDMNKYCMTNPNKQDLPKVCCKILQIDESNRKLCGQIKVYQLSN